MKQQLVNYAEAQKWASQQLEPIAFSGAKLEAEILLAHTLQKQRTHLYAWPEKQLSSEHWEQFQSLVSRRAQHEPIAYIVGHKEFWSLELSVNPNVLIPRPETELLVEVALANIGDNREATIADLGTGSGAIAAAIASEQKGASIIAIERSEPALETAINNFNALNLTNVETRLGSWCNTFSNDERFDLIVSNPPYIAEGDNHLQQGDLPSEPRQALSSGIDGLDDIRAICNCAPNYLKPGGRLIVEHGYDQGNAVRQLFTQSGLANALTHQDLEGRDRISEGIKNS